ncbi:hypothetical protein MKZ38_005708 [Zalerion maritima]|uniref:Uncharacterized protein n=1 Tax=Zalerion maritima TaxID=339359 RepID=A0AAD5RKS7_9PEZI|nr:hypothetical protein MKZ38_005708 [Zalerion maritima]
MKISQKQKLIAIIGISFFFFLAEIIVAFKTKSLALLADAFHYLNDLISFVVALVAIIISERSNSPSGLSFGWQRARLLGAFFNGIFLLALGVSIFLQSIERFIWIEKIEDPKLVLIIGCVGLFLNIVSVTILHEHHHHDHGDSPGALDGEDGLGQPEGLIMEHIHPHHDHKHQAAATEKAANGGHDHSHHHSHDYGLLGVMLHVAGDALNNIGVIVAAVVIWKATYEGRYYADPGVGMGIAIMIFISALPLMKHSGSILIQSAPLGVSIDDVKHDLEKIPGIESVHELHIWRLDQMKSIASCHVVVQDGKLDAFMDHGAKTITECLHAYGIHSATIQPELLPSVPSTDGDTEPAASDTNPITPVQSPTVTVTAPSESSNASTLRRRAASAIICQVGCGASCEKLTCCAKEDHE